MKKKRKTESVTTVTIRKSEVKYRRESTGRQ